jgi:chromosome condensin MukBEF complex kleisin-like MukF subunit
MEKSMEMSFLSHAILRRSDACEEHGDVFFWYALIYS